MFDIIKQLQDLAAELAETLEEGDRQYRTVGDGGPVIDWWFVIDRNASYYAVYGLMQEETEDTPRIWAETSSGTMNVEYQGQRVQAKLERDIVVEMDCYFRDIWEKSR